MTGKKIAKVGRQLEHYFPVMLGISAEVMEVCRVNVQVLDNYLKVISETCILRCEQATIAGSMVNTVHGVLFQFGQRVIYDISDFLLLVVHTLAIHNDVIAFDVTDRETECFVCPHAREAQELDISPEFFITFGAAFEDRIKFGVGDEADVTLRHNDVRVWFNRVLLDEVKSDGIIEKGVIEKEPCEQG